MEKDKTLRIRISSELVFDSSTATSLFNGRASDEIFFTAKHNIVWVEHGRGATLMDIDDLVDYVVNNFTQQEIDTIVATIIATAVPIGPDRINKLKGTLV